MVVWGSRYIYIYTREYTYYTNISKTSRGPTFGIFLGWKKVKPKSCWTLTQLLEFCSSLVRRLLLEYVHFLAMHSKPALKFRTLNDEWVLLGCGSVAGGFPVRLWGKRRRRWVNIAPWLYVCIQSFSQQVKVKQCEKKNTVGRVQTSSNSWDIHPNMVDL